MEEHLLLEDLVTGFVPLAGPVQSCVGSLACPTPVDVGETTYVPSTGSQVEGRDPEVQGAGPFGPLEKEGQALHILHDI